MTLAPFLRDYFELRPVNATFTGVHDHDHALPEWSPDGLDHAVRSMNGSLQHLSGMMNGNGDADESLAASFLRIQIAEITSEHFHTRNPSFHLGEAIFGVIGLMLRDFAPADRRAESVIARLQGWPRFLSNIRASVPSPHVPELWRRRSLRECSGAEILLREGVMQWAEEHGVALSQRRALQEAARQAYDDLRGVSDWLHGCGGGEPIAACGPDLFDALLAEGHRIRLSRRELLESAHDDLATAAQALDSLLREAGADSLDAIHLRLTANHPTHDGYVESFRSLWRECRSLAASYDLCTWPDFPIIYRSFPGWAKKIAPYLYFLYYRSPPPFDDFAEAEYFVPPADDRAGLRATNINVIKQNHVAHHGALGHHVQNYYAYHHASPIGTIAAVDCATRIGMFCGGTMAEGWACYATDLMAEIGFLTADELVSLQENRIKQIVRAIVDIELHQGTMSADQAQAMFVARAGATESGAESEVTKISMFPGTGMMYWYGTKRLHEMRHQQQTADGSSFDPRSFHDRLLQYGSLPVDVIANRMAGERVS